ncbi:hypothetical protein HMN09_00615300 [Mycena chlorophos]|uniref:SAGA-associated factor 11 n=1 Tax=Mycena chlorophos TaxID=658473 RepID=A0A8H6T2X9_MYCCL|nr:hypothetical protein HMN09_00615300 [Mycena chlorophos]
MSSRIPLPVSHPPRSFSPVPDHSRTASMSTLSNSQAFPSPGGVSETRKKQSKRDEAIRKKIESELSRKRTISTTNSMRSGKRGSRVAAAKGTVAALKPSPALTVPESITVSEASQLCAAKRTDCVLVVDDEEGLSGIFTAKDMAYRVTAEGLDPHTTQVHQIMTRNPMVTRDTTSATEALQLMVSKHFRHLPVCNEEGNVVGLLDITKLFAAMAGVQSELGAAGGNPQATAMLAWAERLREKTALPDLTTVMDVRSHPATVGPKTTVREAARLMKERRTTAVCVMETLSAPNGPPTEKIAGIFTSKDVVLRVIAAGLDAGRCSVVRVMTPHPDTAPPTMTIHDALKKMHNGHYLNLPVIEDDGHLLAIIDVLTLTYATLEQMNAMTSGDGNTAGEGEGGPMWGRFFDSIGHDDNDSYLSGSRATPEIHSLASMQHLHPPQSPQSEVHPNDSASVMDDEPSAVGGRNVVGGGSVSGLPPVDDGTYVFKFRTPSGRTHRFQARHDNVEHLREIVAGKLATDPFFTDFKSTSDPTVIPDPIDFHLSYTDADGDSVFITADHDVMDAVKIARRSGADRVVLVVPETPPPVIEAETVKAALVESKAVPTPQIPDEIMGVPKDLLLPASIVTLAVAIIVDRCHNHAQVPTRGNSHLFGIIMSSFRLAKLIAPEANRLFNVMLEDLVMGRDFSQQHIRPLTLSQMLPCSPTMRSRAVFLCVQSVRHDAAQVFKQQSYCCVLDAVFAVHVPPPMATLPAQTLPSRPSTPVQNGSASAGTSTPTKEGNMYIDCVVCSRQIASSRYASHLSSCLGLGTTRRAAVRGSTTKSKPSSDAGGRSTSPEDDSDDGKSKAKSKTKSIGKLPIPLRGNAYAIFATTPRKLPPTLAQQDSPQLTPNKKHKNHGASGSPVQRLKSDSDFSAVLSNALTSPSTNSTTSKVPSKLRDSSTASLFDRSQSPSSRAYSSPPPDSPGASSSYSGFSANGSPIKSSRAKGTGPPKQVSPPRQLVPDYLLDDSGDETGSSTDTDS